MSGATSDRNDRFGVVYASPYPDFAGPAIHPLCSRVWLSTTWLTTVYHSTGSAESTVWSRDLCLVSSASSVSCVSRVSDDLTIADYRTASRLFDSVSAKLFQNFPILLRILGFYQAKYF